MTTQQNRMEPHETEQKEKERNKTEQNKTEENKMERKRTEPMKDNRKPHSPNLVEYTFQFFTSQSQILSQQLCKCQKWKAAG